MILDTVRAVGPFRVIEALFIRDGVNHRATYVPGQDLSGAPEEVKALAKKEHKPALIQAYKEHLANQG